MRAAASSIASLTGYLHSTIRDQRTADHDSVGLEDGTEVLVAGLAEQTGRSLNVRK